MYAKLAVYVATIPGPSSDAVWGQDPVWPDIRDPVAEEASLLYKERYPAIMCFFPTKVTVHHGLEHVKEHIRVKGNP